jgi:hypothetical protein
MDILMNSNEDHSISDEPRLELCAVPLDVQLQIAESKRRMAESRYRLSVARALSWADKSRGLGNPAKVSE